MNINFYSLWFDPTENRTRVYRFSSRRSFHSTADRNRFYLNENDNGLRTNRNVSNSNMFYVVLVLIYLIKVGAKLVFSALKSSNFWADKTTEEKDPFLANYYPDIRTNPAFMSQYLRDYYRRRVPGEEDVD